MRDEKQVKQFFKNSTFKKIASFQKKDRLLGYSSLSSQRAGSKIARSLLMFSLTLFLSTSFLFFVQKDFKNSFFEVSAFVQREMKKNSKSFFSAYSDLIFYKAQRNSIKVVKRKKSELKK